MENEIQEILATNRLSNTEGRRKILELFLSHNGAMAHNDIEKGLGEKIDRVTVYRTLQKFLSKGIIHTIPTSDGSIQYALCKNDCSEGHHHDNHVHFVCRKCGNTACLDEVSTPSLQLPSGFKSGQVEVIVSGICKNCNQ
jgi:Fur family ferric uptake transcriptional regulator